MTFTREQIGKKLQELGIQPFGATYQSLSQADIEEIEGRYKRKLPDDYKWLASEFGLGFFEYPVRIRTAHQDTPLRTFGYFLGTPHDEEYILFWGLELVKKYSHHIPRDCFPIATSGLDSLFCIAMKGWENGRIFLFDYWEADVELTDREKPVGRLLEEPFMTYVADSFGDFIDKLEVFEPTWKPPKLPVPRKRKQQTSDSSENA